MMSRCYKIRFLWDSNYGARSVNGFGRCDFGAYGECSICLVFVIAIPILVFFLVWAMKRAMGLFRSVQEKLDHVNGVMRENLMGMRLVKVFLRKDHERERFDTASDELKRKTVTSLRLIETTMPALTFMMNVST